MVTNGLLGGNAGAAALELLKKNSGARTRRYIYATAGNLRQAALATTAALNTRTLRPGAVPYLRSLNQPIRVPGLSGAGDDSGDVVLNPDGSVKSIGGIDVPNSGSSGGSGLTSSNPWYGPSYDTPSTDSGSSWSNVFASFFGNIGLGLGQKIAGKPGTTPVAAGSSGPSAGALLLGAALIGVPLVYLMTRK